MCHRLETMHDVIDYIIYGSDDRKCRFYNKNVSNRKLCSCIIVFYLLYFFLSSIIKTIQYQINDFNPSMYPYTKYKTYHLKPSLDQTNKPFTVRTRKEEHTHTF